MIDPVKLNAVLTAVAEGVRGQGERIGEATTDLNQVLQALNERSDTIREDWRSFKKFNDTYDAAAQDILTILNSASTTSTTVVDHSRALDRLLLNVIGFAKAGTNLLGAAGTISSARSTSSSRRRICCCKYSPEYTCFLQGAKWYLDNGGYAAWGGADGRTLQLDVALLPGNDPYDYPDNLPIVAPRADPEDSRGAGRCRMPQRTSRCANSSPTPGGEPDSTCGPTPASGIPCWADYFPVTRAVPQPPSIRQCIPGPAPGRSPTPGRRRMARRCTGRVGCRCGPGRPRPRTAGQPGPGTAGTRRTPMRAIRRHRDRDNRHKREEEAMRENLRGVIARLGIFLTVCCTGRVLAGFHLRAAPVRRRQELLRRVHQRVQSEDGQTGPHRRG